MPLVRSSRLPADQRREISFAETKDLGGLFHLLGGAHRPFLGAWNHSHVFDPFWRVYYNFHPGDYIEHDQKRILLGPTRFVIVPANVLFETFSRIPQAGHFYIHFTVHWNYVFPSHQPIVLPADAGGKSLVREVAKSFAGKGVNRTFCHQRSLALLHYLFATVLGERSSETTKRPELVKVLRELGKDPAAFKTVSQLAAFAGMSNRNFQRYFRQAMGKTPLLYLNETRLREAARRLIHSNLSIDEIAFALGFSNRFHFSRLFRHFLGTSPAAFRRKRSAGRADSQIPSPPPSR
jgi:AraC-like DNA-binding protein